MRILAVDQARHGGWCVFDYNNKTIVDYGSFSFESNKYTFSQAVLNIEKIVDELTNAYSIDALFFEDIQMRKNVQSFKKLAQLQGVLVNYAEKNEYQYGIVAPTQWQNYCKARGRSEKEIKNKIITIEQNGKPNSKILSLQFVKDKFDIETDNDNISDSICIGYYVVNNINIKSND